MLDVMRKEIKYAISFLEEKAIANRLRLVMKPDPHNGTQGYMVRSLYFDTLQNQDYFEKMDGLENRKKIRLRIYDPNDQNAKLELKEKHNTSQRKRSILLTRREAEAIISGEYSCLLEKDGFAKELYGIMMSASYRPVCIVQYHRKAFVCKNNDIRITFDSHLSASEGNLNLFDEHLQTYPIELGGTCTMEVKYNHFLFSYIKDAIRICDHLSLSNSKYCRCRYFGLGGE